MAEDEDVRVFVELMVGAAGYLVHGDEGAAFDVRGGVLPGLAHVEEEGRLFRGEVGVELVDGDFEVHALRVSCGGDEGPESSRLSAGSLVRKT